MSEFSLHDPLPTPPPPEHILRKIPGMGTVPLRPGEILTEGESRDLRPFGWQPGDPVPPAFADALHRERTEMAEDVRSGKLRGVQLPAFRTPEEIPVERLPPERQRALSQLLEDYKRAAPAMAQAQQDMLRLSDLDPSVQRAIRAATKDDGVEVTDSRNKPAPMPQPAPPVPIWEPRAEAPATAPPPPPQPAPSPPPPTQAPSQCPHCLADLDQKPTSEPTQDDMVRFVTSVLGGGPFYKTYEFFGGRLKVTFRSASTRTQDLIADQVSADQLEGRIRNLEDLLRVGYAYRLAVSIDTLVFGDQQVRVGKAVDEVLDHPPDGKALLPHLVERLQSRAPLDREGVWNTLRVAAERFGNLLRVLQDRADKPDFWNAIGV